MGRDVQNGTKHITKRLKRFFLFFFFFKKKQHCAAVVERSFSASLTEWQSNATLWMKLCLISSWMQTSQIDTHGKANKGKLKQENSGKAAHSDNPTYTHFQV